MDIQGSVTIWLRQLEEGDEQAARKLWERYFQRLVDVARRKLGHASRRVADEEDVVVAALHSFFTRVRARRFPQLQDRHGLWPLLFTITERKATNQRAWQYMQKRDDRKVHGESWWSRSAEASSGAGLPELEGAEPTPELLAEINDQLAHLLARLPDEDLRTTARLKLHGYTNAEIAEKLGRSKRTIDRRLELIRAQWSATANV